MGFIDDLTEKEKIEYASFGSGGLLLLIGLAVFFLGSQGIGGALFLAGYVGYTA